MNPTGTMTIKVYYIGKCFGFCVTVEECKGTVKLKRGCWKGDGRCSPSGDGSQLWMGVKWWQLLKFPSIEKTQICVWHLTIFNVGKNTTVPVCLFCFVLYTMRPARCDVQARAKRGDLGPKTSVRPQRSVVLSTSGLFLLHVFLSFFFFLPSLAEEIWSNSVPLLEILP